MEQKAFSLPSFPYKDTMAATKAEMMKLLLTEEYGFYPCRETAVTFDEVKKEENFCAGKAIFTTVMMHATFQNGAFSFPIRAVLPAGKQNVPFFVHINFRPDVPDRYQPTEEIIDNGFAILSFCYEEVTSDDGDFSNGVSPFLLGADTQRNGADCGKIAMWAWAASRVLDYAYTLDVLDKTQAYVVGHSRLGKTALLAGALDERFTLSISNDSGCSGAALFRGKQGEKIDDICRNFPFWFCKNFQKYRNREEELPFDQHFLLASIAPRKVYVASAEEDLWADPEKELACCFAADEYYRHYGLPGLSGEKGVSPLPLEKRHGGLLAYHCRPHRHYLAREDWLFYMEYAKGNRD